MPPSPNESKPSKFTRGEKCLFAHLAVTLGVILLMTLAYLVHVWVKHTSDDANTCINLHGSNNRSRSGLSVSDYQSVGVMFLNGTPPTLICVTLLLAPRWSLAPAQCTSMRDDPDLSNYQLQWKIKYKIGGKHIHTDIKRTLTHSHFNRGDYQNNIGLFEHTAPIFKNRYFVAPKNIRVDDASLEKYKTKMAIVDWKLNFEQNGGVSDSIANKVRPILSARCAIDANPIVERLRAYEFCVTFEPNGPTADHGAIIAMNSKIVGFFSWGDLQGRGVPLIILNILHFREWFESITR
ncbi:hypothetical protein PYW07_000218 [Mythimna separata]|uniref:Peptidase S1 domain-containing protein n=1 Tax=Mythimna separata TaxID=271217 RepID=A0AAD8E1C1_MYTSE|nr:hypothetical protein PYW07_000218 [Mythimna separata]